MTSLQNTVLVPYFYGQYMLFPVSETSSALYVNYYRLGVIYYKFDVLQENLMYNMLVLKILIVR